MSRLLAFAVLLGWLGVCSALPPAETNPVSLISIVVEKRAGERIEALDPRHVFDSGDTVRFRLKPQVDGYLYVLDLSTSGRYDVLFPRAETGTENHIARGQEYVLPATRDGWFRVAGPAGYERLYFVLSPAAIGAEARKPPLQPKETAPSTMKPRCNDELFRARGECMDAGAGPRTVTPGEALPRGIGEAAQGASRDLQFTRSGPGSVVTSRAPLSGPVVYEFLLAHK